MKHSKNHNVDISNNKHPMVSVIMGVYNGEAHVKEAISSVLSQSIGEFEFVIVNDGSTDGTSDILNSFNDSKICVINQHNLGQSFALNKAAGLSKGKYLAVMDADDISLPNRLKKTVDFLESHPQTVMVGTGWIDRYEHSNTEIIRIPPTGNSALRKCLLKYDPFTHPSILMRSSVFRRAGGYNTRLNHGFDCELYSRLAKIGRISTIEDVLIVKRLHNKQFFRTGYTAEEHRKRRLKIRWLTLWRLNPTFILFLQTLIWICFEYIVHLVPDKARHKLPENFRDFFKAYLPPKVLQL